MELLTVFILAAVLPHSALSTPESDALLDAMLEADGIALAPAALAIRREIFEFVYLTQEAGDRLSLEDMYTEEEREKQNGAVPAARELLLVNEELQKRAESILDTVSAPRAYDARKLTIPGSRESLVNPVQNQQTCGNCYLHTFIAALEIAYAKATAEKVKFSEQEMTDCYFKGCNGGDYRMVSVLMSYIDKLSSRKDYGDYLNGKFTCRQATTPDSLAGIKITGYVGVTPKTAAAAIFTYGSVMTCMAWGSGPGQKCRMDNYDGVSVIRGTPVADGEEGSCAHAVLIVGYTEDYYIVRNSHGHSWGDDGYFYIERNTNSCGIETTMAAITVESRAKQKPLAPNKCPTDKPKFCSEISTCVEKGQECIQVPSAMKKREVMRYTRSLGELEDEEGEKPVGWGLPGMQLEKRQQCTDKMGARCPAAVKQFGCDTQNMDIFCALSCNKCKASAPVIVVPPSTGEKTGDCFRPAIANGVATNKPIMKYKEQLQVRCNAGYNLVGEPVYCLIQNVFTNKDKDARLMPECMKLGSDVLVGNGAGYTGSQNQYKDVLGRTKTCDSWNKDVLEGQLMNKLDGYKYKLGNHNFCRNPTGTEPVPMCLGFNEYNKIAEPVYCFEHPNCSVCQGASDSSDYQSCQTGKNNGLCKYTDSRTVQAVNYYWRQCTKTCCSDQC